MKFVIILFASYLIVGCSSENLRIPRLAQPWEVTGRIKVEDGESIPNQVRLILSRDEPGSMWCLGCLGGRKPFMFVYTSADGMFYFSSTIPGSYSVEAHCPNGKFGVPLFEPLGVLNPGVHQINPTYLVRNCVAR